MLDQYLKKKEKHEVIEILSDDQPPQPPPQIKKKLIIEPIEVCKEEEVSTIIKQMIPKPKPEPMIASSPQRTHNPPEATLEQNSNVRVSQNVRPESENEYDYEYVINCLQEVRESNKDAVVTNGEQKEKMDVEPNIASQSLQANSVSRKQFQAPIHNLAPAIIRGWMSHILVDKKRSKRL